MDQITFAQSAADRACVTQRAGEARRRLAAVPSDPGRVLTQILEASGIDIGAVEPDTFFELLTTYLPRDQLEPIANLPPRRLVRAGIERLIRYARIKTWDDLERRPFAGKESLLWVLRQFPGLEGMRLPDRAYDASAQAETWGSWDEGALPF
jgi:hypothetical protein